MKKKLLISVVIAFCFALMLVMTAFAKDYVVSETDLTVNIDDTVWYVFTRDNIENNLELDELGVSYDYMNELFQDNQVFLDAILFYDDGETIELFVRKTKNDKMVNLSNYNEDDVRLLAKKIAERVFSENYSVYESEYKFAKMEYIDQEFNICEYVTVINGENYTFTFQATAPFVDEEYVEMKSIVDSARFEIDESLKENKFGFSFDGVVLSAIKGGVIGAIVGGFSWLISKRKKKNQMKHNEENNI